MAVRNLPLFPEHVFPINTPRPERGNAGPSEPVAPSVRAQIDDWWEKRGAVNTATIARLCAEEISASNVANLERQILKRFVETRDFLRLNESLSRREAEIHKLQGEIRTLSENVALFNRELVELKAKSSTPAPILPVSVQFTPWEWVLIVLTLGIYRPTKRQP